MPSETFALLADAAMVLHFAFLAFLLVGGFAAWCWRWVIIPHLAAAAWALVNAVIGVDCPLTFVEDWARESAGQSGLNPGGFIAHYLTGVIYPEAYLGTVRATVSLLIAVSWAGYWWRWRHHARDAEHVSASPLTHE